MIAATLFCVLLPLAVRALTLNSRRIVPRVGSGASALWSRWVCRILDLRINVHGAPSGDTFLVAANHMSYLDIWVLGSLYPSVFVAKQEIRSWPLFGWISRAAGTLFVDRDNPRDAVRVIRKMRELLAAGVSLTLFPEGGTSRGDTIRPFLPTLLEPAARAGVPCFAASLSYETPGASKPPSVLIPWNDGANFVGHIVAVMRQPRIEVTVAFSEQAIQSPSRKELARRLWEDATSTFVPLREQAAAPPCAP